MNMDVQTMKRWLVASLIVNVFLVGGIAGGTWRWWTAERAAAPTATAQPRGLRYAADELSAAQRRVYLTGLREARRQDPASTETARAGRQEVLRLLGAPQFDRIALGAALARTREADTALRAHLEASVVDFAGTLSAADRERFASGMAKRTTMSPASAPGPTPPKL